MNKYLRASVGVVVLGTFAVLFVSAGGLDAVRRPAATATPVVVTRGHYQQYLYGISDISGKNKKLAQFDPSLPSDNAVVLGALRAMAKDSYRITIDDAAQPAVETIDEVNYVTYVVGSTKLYFELFANSSGQVGSVRFWRQ